MSEESNFTICPVCYKDKKFELETAGTTVKHLYTSDSGFSGPGKDRTVKDTFAFTGEQCPHFWVHLFPVCPVCCGTGVVLDSDDFFQLQNEVAMVSDNLEEIIETFKDEPSVLREHAERLTLVLIPLIIKRSLRLVKTPAKHSYARYLATLFNVKI